MESKDLQHVYSLLSDEITKVKHKIDIIDKTLVSCDRLTSDYWVEVRAESVA